MDTREKIIETAEILFAGHGYEGCTFRMISDKAGVNQGLLHYHFGSKENLFSEMFLRRAADLVERRLTLLEAAASSAPDHLPQLSDVIRCFIEPPLRMLQGTEGERAFIRIHARLRSEPLPFALQLRRTAFGASTRRFVDVMAEVCQHLSRETVAWRFNCMVGTYLVVVTQGARISDLSDGTQDASDIEKAIPQLTAFLIGGFAASDIVPTA